MISRSLASYERMARRIAALEQKVREQNAELRCLRPKGGPPRGYARIEVPPAEHIARLAKCEICGAEPGSPCRRASDDAMPRAHHMRGRVEHCGRKKCYVCRREFKA